MFILEDAFRTGPDVGPARLAFLLRSLDSLRKNLAEIGYPLIVRHGRSEVELHKLAEEVRVGIRHWRTDARDRFKKLDGVSEDDVKHAEKDLQKLHDDFIAKVDGLVKAKEAEIMEV